VLALHLLNRRRPSSPRDVLCLHSIFSTDDTLRRAETYCACTASSQPTTARFAAQSRAVLAQHLLNRRRPSSPRGVLCLHSIFSTDDTLRRAETYCACTASSQPTTPFVAQRRIVLAQHLLNRRQRLSSRRSTLCSHCTAAASLQPDTVRLAAQKPTMFLHHVTQHRLDRRQRASPRRKALYLHSIFSSKASGPFADQKRTVRAQHIPTQRQRPSSHRSTLCLRHAKQHLLNRRQRALRREMNRVCTAYSFDREPVPRHAETYCICAIFSTNESALYSAETHCVCTVSSSAASPPFVASAALCSHSILLHRGPALRRKRGTVFTQHSSSPRARPSSRERHCVYTASSSPRARPSSQERHCVYTAFFFSREPLSSR